MIFNAFQREESDNVFTVVYNVSGAALTVGQVCVWDTSASIDGLRVTNPAANTYNLFRGIVTETSIADSGYGKALVHGYYAAAQVSNGTAGGTDIVAGDVLAIATTGATYLQRVAAGTGYTGYAYAGEAFATATTPGAAAKKVLVRAL